MFLDELNRISESLEGLQALALVGEDGLPVDSVTHDDQIDLEMLAAEMVALLRSMSENDEELGAGPIQQLLVETEGRTLITSSVVNGYYLLAVGGEDFLVGKARFELRRAPLALAEELS
ncbi:MAG: roadblock/LC7 domain-containing protein [Acidobacteriota bacterium]